MTPRTLSALPSAVEVTVELGSLQSDPEVSRLAILLAEAMRRSPQRNGFGDRINLVVHGAGGNGHADAIEPRKMILPTHGSAPSDWYDREDQMSRPRQPSGPNTWE